MMINASLPESAEPQKVNTDEIKASCVGR